MDRVKLPDCIVAAVIIIAVCFGLIFLTDNFKGNENMKETITDGYVYDINTKIIYIESKAGFYKSYSVYYNENGNLCKYNIINDKFEEIVKE